MPSLPHRALITGASRGIGRAIALALADTGTELVLNWHRDRDGAETTLRQVHEAGVSARLLQFDVADVAAATEAVTQFLKEHGPIDVVVHNAGIKRDVLLMGMKASSWREVIDTSLGGFYAVCKPCLRGMLARGWGRIVSISSAAALAPSPGQVAYSAAKAGLVGATRSLSAEVCSRGITVNCVAPGFIDTDMLRDLKMERQQLLKLVPMGRLGTPQEVAAVVAFLVSEQAGYVTGQVIGVNGGMI